MNKFRAFLPALGASLALTVPAAAQAHEFAVKKRDVIHKQSTVEIQDNIKATLAAAKTPLPAPVAALKPFVDWCRQTTPSKFYGLRYTTTIIDGTSATVGYSEGWLRLDGVSGLLWGGPFRRYLNEDRDAAGQPFRSVPGPARKLMLNPATGGGQSFWFSQGITSMTQLPPLQGTGPLFYAHIPRTDVPGFFLYVITLEKISQ
jgi:hypothetical protein